MGKNTKLQFYRNTNLFDNKEKAISGLENEIKKSSTSDGEIVLARYNNGDSVETVFGIAAKNGTQSGCTIFDSSSSTIKEEITVAGGKVGGFAEGSKISAGTSIEAILKKLLCEELYPNAATKPSLKISGVTDNLGVVEVGSTVTIGGVGIQEVNGKFNASYTNVEQPIPQGVNFTSKSIIGKNENFQGQHISALTNSSSSYLGQVQATVQLGRNVMTYTASANYSAPTNKPLTNLKNPTDKTSETAAVGSAIWMSGSTSTSAETKAIGVYPCYTNISSGNTLLPEANNRLELQTGATFTITNVPAENVSNQVFMFDFPATHSISSFKIKGSDGFYDFKGDYTSTTTLQKTVQGKTVSYKRLKNTNISQGVVTYQITLNKSLDQ